jgi:hypothetical protein
MNKLINVLITIHKTAKKDVYDVRVRTKFNTDEDIKEFEDSSDMITEILGMEFQKVFEGPHISYGRVEFSRAYDKKTKTCDIIINNQLLQPLSFYSKAVVESIGKIRTFPDDRLLITVSGKIEPELKPVKQTRKKKHNRKNQQ